MLSTSIIKAKLFNLNFVWSVYIEMAVFKRFHSLTPLHHLGEPMLSMRWCHWCALGTSVYFRHLFGGRDPPPQKKELQSTQTADKLCTLNLFFDRDNELPVYYTNCLLMDNKHRKLLVIKQWKGCKLMPKMHQNIRLAAGLCQDPLWEFMRSPRCPGCNAGA